MNFLRDYDFNLEEVTKGQTEDAQASIGEEGRGKLRKSAGICKRELIRRYPNGGTRLVEGQSRRNAGKRRELKHLSTCRKRKKNRFSEQWRAKGEQPKPVMLRHSRGCRTAILVNKKKWNELESQITEGDNPVRVSFISHSGILSRAGHEESCLNLRGPSRKAKY